MRSRTHGTVSKVERCHNAHQPAVHIGTSKTPIASSVMNGYFTVYPIPECSDRRFASIASVSHACVASQTKLGAQPATATARPPHNQRLEKTAVCRFHTSPIARPARSNRIVCLRLEPDPDGQTHREPKALGCGTQDADHQPRHQRPDEDVVDRGPLQVPEHQEPHGRDAQGGECLPNREPQLTAPSPPSARPRPRHTALGSGASPPASLPTRIGRATPPVRPTVVDRRTPTRGDGRGEEVQLVAVISVARGHREEHPNGD